MSFIKKSKRKNVSKSMPGTLGAQIKKYRELRDFSMKELGSRCGFPVASGDVRIAEYEANRTVPSEKSLQDLAEALELDKDTLHGTSATTFHRMMHDMFVMEEIYGIHPECINGEYFLKYDPLHAGSLHVGSLYSFLKDWYEMHEQCKPNIAKSIEENETRRKKYEVWKGIYPTRFDDDARLEMEDAFLLAATDNEGDRKYAEHYTENRLTKFYEELEDVISNLRNTWKPITTISDFIIIMMKAMTNGLDIYKGSPQQYSSEKFGLFDLFSIKVKDILSSEENKNLYAEIYCGVYILNKAHLGVECRVTALNKEIYLTYSCSMNNMLLFGDIVFRWDDMCNVIETKKDKSVSKEDATKVEEIFLSEIRAVPHDWRLRFI